MFYKALPFGEDFLVVFLNNLFFFGNNLEVRLIIRILNTYQTQIIKKNVMLTKEDLNKIESIINRVVEEKCKELLDTISISLSSDDSTNTKPKREILLEEDEELLDRSSAEKMLKVSNATLSKFIKDGLIKPQSLGRKHFYLKSDVQYLENVLNARGWYKRNEKNRNR